MEIDLNTACDRIELFAREGRLTGGEWHDERDGRELACIYGSIDPSISSIDDCPASLGPVLSTFPNGPSAGGFRADRHQGFGGTGAASPEEGARVIMDMPIDLKIGLMLLPPAHRLDSAVAGLSADN